MSDRTDPPKPPEYDPYEGLSDLTGEEPLPPLEDPALPPATPPRSPLLTGLILGLLLVVLSIAVFNLTRDDETDGTAAPTDTTAATDDTSADPNETTGTTGGDEAPTDTSTTTTSSTAAPVQFDPYTAVGQPLALSDLTLQTSGLGVISLGTDAGEAIGKLVATLGEPTSDTGPITSTGEYGACEGGTVRIVKFGALAAVVIVDPDGAETFGGYRLDFTYDGAATSVAVELETLSGLKLGNNVTDLRNIYAAFDVEVVTDADYGTVFELRGSSGNLLLWGPVVDSGNEGTDIIMGIYAADADGTFC